MKIHSLSLSLVISIMGAVGNVAAQAPDQQQPAAGQASGGQERGPRGGQEGRRPGVFGKITAIQADSIEVTGPDGSKTTLKLTGSTEYRKDRQPAKLADFKVGDNVLVRTDQANGNPGNAAMVAGVGQGMGMRAGPGGGHGMFGGSLGKDFVMGEVKSLDPPKITVLRTDGVTQTLELNEETSLRRGRDSITMADIQTGDHVVAHGGVENNVFVPKNLNVIPPEAWKRMQEFMNGGGFPTPGAPAAPASPSAPAAPSTPPPPSQQNTAEPQN